MGLFKILGPEEKFWEWFKKHEKQLLQWVDSRDTDQAIFKDLIKEIRKVHPDLAFEFGPLENEERIFILSADGLRDVLPVVEKLYNYIPEMKGWKFLKFRQRDGPVDIQLNDITVHYSDISVTLEKDGDKVGISVYIKDLDSQNQEDHRLQHAAFLMLDNAIGEYDMVTKVGFVEFFSSDTPSELKKYSLDELPEAFDDFAHLFAKEYHGNIN